MKNTYLISAVVAVIVGAMAFYGGMKYQQSQRIQFQGMAGERNGFGGQKQGVDQGGGNRMQGFRPVNGEIINADETSITVKLEDGSSKIILLSETTKVNKAEAAEKSDLKTGEKVAVFGTENSDGSVTAQRVQLNPELRVMMGRPGSSPQ